MALLWFLTNLAGTYLQTPTRPHVSDQFMWCHYIIDLALCSRSISITVVLMLGCIMPQQQGGRQSVECGWGEGEGASAAGGAAAGGGRGVQVWGLTWDVQLGCAIHWCQRMWCAWLTMLAVSASLLITVYWTIVMSCLRLMHGKFFQSP
jgi:hypothetical protein